MRSQNKRLVSSMLMLFVNTSAVDYYFMSKQLFYCFFFVFQVSRNVVLCYSTSLSRLHQLCFAMCSCLSDSEHDDGEGWKLLKGVHGASPACGYGCTYWAALLDQC